jgi:hypothetical protein
MIQPPKQLNIQQADIRNSYELSFQLKDGWPVRRVIISRQQLLVLLRQADRLLAMEPSNRF